MNPAHQGLFTKCMAVAVIPPPPRSLEALQPLRVPRMSEIERFRLVLAVARTHSIGEVALITGLSQPTVTRAVSATEQLVGFPLFHRTSDGTVPTANAPAAFTLIESILADYDTLADLDGNHTARLRFAYRDGELPPVLENAVARWNRERLSPAKLIPSDDPIATLLAGDAEFAVARYTGSFPDGLAHEPLRMVRADRTDLVHVTPPNPSVTEFRKFFG